MTKTRKVLNELVKGAQSLESLMEATGMPLDDVRSTIWHLTFTGCIAKVPATFVLSAEGMKKAEKKNSTSPRKLAQLAAARKSRKERMLIAERMRTKGIVNSVFNLGAQL